MAYAKGSRSYSVTIQWIRSSPATKKLPKKAWRGTVCFDEDSHPKQRSWPAVLKFDNPPVCSRDVSALFYPHDHCPLLLLKAGVGFDLIEGRTIVARGMILGPKF